MRDLEKQRRYNRNWYRKRTHGADWRSIVDKYACSCVNADNPAQYPDCLVEERLEFHAPMGESKPTDTTSRFFERVLMCATCHQSEHTTVGRIVTGNFAFPLDRAEINWLWDDIQYEIDQASGYKEWKEKYNVRELA